MFTNNKNTNQVLERNIIAKNTSVASDIKSDGNFKIDGTVG